MRRILSIAVAGLFFAGVAAACGDDDNGGGGTASPEAFCAETRTLEDRFEAFDEEDPAQMQAAVQELRSISVPSEIRDDWDNLVDAMDEMTSVLAEIDPDNPDEAFAAFERLAELEETFENLEESADNIEEYVREECGFELSGDDGTDDDFGDDDVDFELDDE